MSEKDFLSLLEVARDDARRDLQHRRETVKRKKIQLAKEAAAEIERQKIERNAADLRTKKNQATRSALVRVLAELAAELETTSKYIQVAPSTLHQELRLSVSYWSIRLGETVVVPESNINIEIKVDEDPDEPVHLGVGRRVLRGSIETLTNELRDLLLPQMARHVAKAEIAVEIELSDDYDDLND